MNVFQASDLLHAIVVHPANSHAFLIWIRLLSSLIAADRYLHRGPSNSLVFDDAAIGRLFKDWYATYINGDAVPSSWLSSPRPLELTFKRVV